MSQYSDGWTYQENLLSKYHKKMGYEVTIITSMLRYKEGKLVEDGKKNFVDVNGVNVIRLEKKNSILSKFPIYKNFYETIESENPDIIFSHGCQYVDVNNLIKYKKNNSNVKIYVDNHADFTNSGKNWFSKNILHKIIWRKYAQKLIDYTEIFWGVLPSRVDFLTDIYEIPKEKVQLLVMGADDELVHKYMQKKEIEKNRNELSLETEDFVIVTGGKFDSYKKGVIDLMEAVKDIDSDKVKLLIFGSIDESLKEEFDKILNYINIIYLGWANYEESYKYFSVANLVVFNGRHSVFWEQVVGQGLPLFVKKSYGTHHIDLGGNIKYLEEGGVNELKGLILSIMNSEKKYNYMKEVAENKGLESFLYSNIAKKSIELI